MSLSKKLILMGVLIGSMTPLVGMIAYYQFKKVAALQDEVSDVKLVKTKQLAELVFMFRDIRLQVRTIPVRGMSRENIDRYIEKTKKSVSIFVESQKKYKTKIENSIERDLFESFESSSQDFLEFGNTLINLASFHDETKLDELSKLVQEVCPVKAQIVEKAITTIVDQKNLEAQKLTDEVHIANDQTKMIILFGSIICFLLALSVGTLVARSISSELQRLADHLSRGAWEVTGSSKKVSENGSSLSHSTTQQAEALQETVSAIEEISSMIIKNSENADNSKKSTASSLQLAKQGKELVEELTGEVQSIHQSTVELVDTVEHGNREITKIVNLINEIESKTKVINDIVFQTKLLSFNASVEAARAGESGKGFAVVAEEVGNLAAMSGKSAKEISDLLSNSVGMVENIVKSTKDRIEVQAQESKARVHHGIELGKRCGQSLVQILESAQSVDLMVTEIASASREQSVGVSEVSKSMHQMDNVTQKNRIVASSTASAAEELSTQALEMKSLVDRLYITIHGSIQSSRHDDATLEADAVRD